MPTSLEIGKQALAWAGTRTTITAIDDTTQEGKYIGMLYNPLRDFLLREGDYDWASKLEFLTFSGLVGYPWSRAYVYPSDCIRIRQLFPTTFDTLDPQPIEWNVTNSGSGRQIVTNSIVNAVLYTFAPNESVFDPIFTQSFVKLLGSGLMFALENRIEASDNKLREALTYAGIADLRDS